MLRLRFRETKVDSSQDSVSSMELCVVFPGVIARFDGSDIQVFPFATSFSFLLEKMRV